MIKYTKHFLGKLEALFAETDYILRYEKGNFRSGYCLIRDSKVAIVNKYYSLEGKINSLIDILREVALDPEQLSPAAAKLYGSLLAEADRNASAELSAAPDADTPAADAGRVNA